MMKQSRGISPALIVLLLLLAIAAFILEWIRTPEHPVLAEPPHSTDMAVIGGTTAALLTAIHGAQAGAQVYLFPQAQELGEDAEFLLSGGLAAPLHPTLQDLEEPLSQLEIEDFLSAGELEGSFSPMQFKERLQKNGGNLNDPALLDAFIQFSTNLHPMMERIHGTVFDHLPAPNEHPYLHFSSQPINPASFARQLEIQALRAGVIIKNTYVKELIFSPEGHVRGLLLEKSGGESEMLNLRSVVLADGGYSGDPFSWHPYLPENNMLLLRPGQQGRGLLQATALGMDVMQAGFYRRRILLYSPFNETSCLLAEQPYENAYFFNNEGQLLKWSEASNQEIINFVHMSPLDGVYLLVRGEDIPEACGHLFRSLADWESLAQFCGGDLPTFPLPFSPNDIHNVSPVRVGLDYTLGGLAVTPHGEVKRNGTVVTGLYAAGEICGGLHGEAVLPGMPLSETLFLSAVAGEAAAHHAWR